MCSFTPDFDRDRAKASPDRVDALVWAFTELMVEGTAQAWIDHYGAMAAAANASPPPVAGDALPWRPKPAPSRPIADNELIDIYNETADASLSNRDRRYRDCGQPMTPGATRITDGVDVWHPGCAAIG